MSEENSRSPYEQGELESSPEIAKENLSKKKERQASFSPEQNKASQTIVIDRDSEDDTLNIKPPQSQSGKRLHKHKHKDDRRRERGRQQEREREKDHGRDRERNRVGHMERHRMQDIRTDRLERAQDRIRDKKDYREREKAFERERFEETREEREVRETKKREQSQLERERLEEKERQKQREIRIREERERKEEREKRKIEEKRSQIFRQERNKVRSITCYRSRSREGHCKRNLERRDERFPREDKSSFEDRKKGPRTPPEEIYNEEESQEENVIDIDGVSSEPEHEEHVQTDSVAGSESESDSGSDSISASSEEESSANKQEEEGVNASDHTLGVKLKSKFDELSDHESGNESVSDNENRAYIQESPPASPLQEEVKLPPYLPAIQGCRSVEEFRCLNRIEEGTYGVVYRAKDKKNDEIVALKRLKMEKEKEGFPITSLREINTLLKAQHPNIVTVREIVVGSNMDKIYIVMDYVEHDLKSLMEVMKTPFSIGETKTLMKQLLRAVSHLHDNWILHRDLKTSNLLFSHKGVLKVGDFGLAREYGSPLRQYTPIVVTLWYRAPELLLGCKEYSTAIDLWSVGCIFAEFLTMKPLWPGKSEIDEINRIFKDLGTPNEKIWPGVSDLPGMKKCNFADHPFNAIRNRFGAYLSDLGFDLLNRFLTYSPSRRISAEEALNHKYFEESPLPVDPSMFPTWPAKSEQPRKHISSPKPPSGGKAYSRLVSEESDLGFHMSSAAKGASAVGNPGFTLKF